MSKNGVVILGPFFPPGVVTPGEDVTQGFMGDSNEPHSLREATESTALILERVETVSKEI